MLLTKLLAVVASLATADVVRDAAELRAALADGAPSIELAADIYLEGDEAHTTSRCVIDGNGHSLLQAGARHLRASAPVELRDLTLRGQYESRLPARDERAEASAPSREAWTRQRWLGLAEEET